MPGRFEGKVGVVTGAANGFGEAVAGRLIADGASVVLVDVNDKACRIFKMTRESLLAIGPDKITPPLQLDGEPSAYRPRRRRLPLGREPLNGMRS